MNIDTFSVERLGTSATVEEVNIGERPMIKITGTPNESTVSVLVRAPTHHVVEEIKRALTMRSAWSQSLTKTKVCTRRRCTIHATLTKLKEYAATVGGREQMAVEAFANALEVIPKTLAANSGLRPNRLQ